MAVAPTLRTLLVLPTAQPGTEATLAADLLIHLVRGEIEPAVCFLEPGPLVPRWEDALGMPVHTLAGPAGRAPEAVAEVIRATGARVVHAVGAAAQVVAGRAARRTTTASLWTQTGCASWRDGTQIRASLLPARAVLLHSDAAARAQHRLNLRRIPCRRVPAGVTLAAGPAERRRSEARMALGLPSAAVVAASVGPLDAAGHATFLRAGASLCHARPAARLLVVATAPADAARVALQRLAASLGLDGRMQVVEPADATDALEASDIVVHPAGEGPNLPMSLVRALAAGRAVIAFDTPVAREFVHDGTDALLADGHDHEALAVHLLALADDAPRRTRLGAGASAAARERHDAAAMAATVADLYRAAARR